MATRKVNRQRRKARAAREQVDPKPGRNLGQGFFLDRVPTGRAANLGRGA